MRKIVNIVARLWITLTVAAVVAPVGSWIGWHGDSAGLPSDEQLRGIVAEVNPGYEGGAEFQRFAYVTGSPYGMEPGSFLRGQDEYGAGYAEARFSDPTGDLGAVATRLRAAGWRAGDASGEELTAARGEWRLIVRPPADLGESAVAEVQRAQPTSEVLLSGVFWLVGAVLGLGLARVVRGRPGGLGVAALGLMGLHTLLVNAFLVANIVGIWGTGPFLPLWEPIMTVVIRPLTMLGALVSLIWLADVAFGRRTGRVPAVVS